MAIHSPGSAKGEWDRLHAPAHLSGFLSVSPGGESPILQCSTALQHDMLQLWGLAFQLLRSGASADTTNGCHDDASPAAPMCVLACRCREAGRAAAASQQPLRCALCCLHTRSKLQGSCCCRHRLVGAVARQPMRFDSVVEAFAPAERALLRFEAASVFLDAWLCTAGPGGRESSGFLQCSKLSRHTRSALLFCLMG